MGFLSNLASRVIPDRARSRHSFGAQAPGSVGGGMSGGMWDQPSGNSPISWGAAAQAASAQQSLAANREQNTPARKLAESRAHKDRGNPGSPGRARTTNSPQSTGTIMSNARKAAGKSSYETGAPSGYSPYATSDTGHL